MSGLYLLAATEGAGVENGERLHVASLFVAVNLAIPS
jgi:hypothetical protein